MRLRPAAPVPVFLILFWVSHLAIAQAGGPDAAHPAIAREDSGQIEGLVSFRGQIPKSPVADDAGVRRELLRVDRETRGLQNVVVWLEMAGRSPNTNTTPALMDQRDHEFVPRVLAVRAGQPVTFRNSDPANHNVRTTSLQPTNDFNVFTGADGSYTHRFSIDPGHRPVRVGCDIHPWMRGWIYVFDNRWFSVTDEHGRFQIGGVPPGQYQLQLRQPDVRYTGGRPVAITNARSTSVQLEITAESLAKPGE